ncbi:MAG: gamma-glutamylcyclotransferase family protein [Verrucomicrobiota bacterium]
MGEFPEHLFVYGTLMEPEVLRRLLGHVLEMRPAVIRGYRRFRVRNAVYPGIVAASPESSTTGKILSGLLESDWKTLDAFEGDEYERLLVETSLESGETIPAATYVFRDPANLTDELWDRKATLKSLRELGLED